MAESDNLVEKVKGQAKEIAGDAVGDDELRREGQAQQHKVEAEEEAERLEQEAERKRQQAAGHKGEQKSEAQG
jgi:uncharacterized protein YjbJ (UPF0337 family)